MDLVDQVTQQLKAIELEDDDISEYIVGIVQDDSIEDDEKHQVIGEFLAETTDEPTDSLIDTILSNWKAMKQDQEKVELDRKAQQVEQAQALEKERLIKSEKEREELAQKAAELAATKQLSKEQKIQRDRLRQQYDDMDTVSRDGKKRGLGHEYIVQ
ncbi:hypothetical protein BCR42DRAFT_332294 [Absidia repens]|uniref:CCDC43 PWI-like domain-containing protein n=1 Tax=Absidia repens TaxID=90262 RepID=A0A1X2I8L6_9FUNG|nr:hypothetical protein BCR42DRAFT_332294 [Absidia repens]